MNAPLKAASLPPFRPLKFVPRDIAVERRTDGSMVLRSRVPLAPYAPHVPSYLAKWAAERPDHVWMAQRRGPNRDWQKLSYGAAKAQVDAMTQALLNLGLDEARPAMILSGNSLEHAIMMLAAMQARVPAAPVSVAYSLMSQDHAKLKYVFDLLRPGLVMVQNATMYERALKALPLDGVHVVHVEAPSASIPSTAFGDLLRTNVSADVQRSIDAIGPKTVGKYLFTSGSTGMPKAVINTHEMMCANVTMMKQLRIPDPDEPPPVVLNWLPWNHTMAGNAGFNGLLAEGGTLYLDDGRPLPGQFDESLRNLREISLTGYSNVPAAYATLAAAMEKDEALCRTFFKNLRSLGYGGATLSSDLYDRMQALAIKYTGMRMPFLTGYGSTETAPTATATYWTTERVGLIGLPYPGVDLKLVPVGHKYEVRVRGIIVTPGYYKRPDLTEAAFDEEGFYKIGDAATFQDPNDINEGLVFAGRVVEDFKLNTGTFVHVGSLRVAAIAAAAPALQDAVVAGQDKEFIGLLAWPNLMNCRQIAGKPEASLAELIADPKVIACVRDGLARHNRENPGSSFQIKRVILMEEPPSIDGSELTDKGYINQRATLDRRAGLVAKLYAEKPAGDVIVIP